MNNILVAVDLTDNSENAFLRALQLSRLSGGKLHVLHIAFDAILPGRRVDTSIHAKLEEQIRDFVKSHVKSADFDYAVHIESGGRVYEVIDRYARSLGADLVVIGRSERSNVIPDSVLLTTGQVVVNAHCPVLIVTQPVSRNYEHILIVGGPSARPETLIGPICDFGPDIQLTLLHEALDDSASAGLIRRLRVKWQRRRDRKSMARIVSMLQQRSLPSDRAAFEAVKSVSMEAVQSRFTNTNMDVVALTEVRDKLLHPEKGGRLRNALEKTSFDVLVNAQM